MLPFLTLGVKISYSTLMIETLLLQLSQMETWKIALLVSGLLYQGAFFTVFPEEVIIVTLGILVSQGKISFLHAWAAVAVGLLPANSTTVFLCTRFGPKLLKIPPFSWAFKEKDIKASLAQIHKYGKGIIFLTRFTPMVRAPIYFATGLSGFGVLRFMAIDSLASCIQIPGLLWIGGRLGANAESLLDAYKKLGLCVLVSIVLVLGGRWLWKKYKA